jgi:deoxyribodipyrimidine photolyase-related protein
MYWTGKTKMKCMKESIKPVIEEGYSHHIQRLMVLSNFSNLTETDPRELNRWFWFAYVDAYEWVELPNVLGMSTFADGGVLASKPYVSSGNYINKMSDYCKHCEYSVTKKTGEGACPFNYLYWNFVDQQRETFNDSGRVNFMVNMFDNKKSDKEKKAIRESTKNFLSKLERES